MADDLDSSGEEAEEAEGEEEEHEAGSIFADYRPSKLPYGRPHPDAAVETASLAAVVSQSLSAAKHFDPKYCPFKAPMVLCSNRPNHAAISSHILLTSPPPPFPHQSTATRPARVEMAILAANLKHRLTQKVDKKSANSFSEI